MEEKNLLAIDVHAEALEELRQRQTVCFVNLIKAEQVYKPRSELSTHVKIFQFYLNFSSSFL